VAADAPGRAPGVVGGPLRYLQGPPGPRRPTWGATAGAVDWLLGRPELVRVAATESIAGWPNSQFFCFLEPFTTKYAQYAHWELLWDPFRGSPGARARCRASGVVLR